TAVAKSQYSQIATNSALDTEVRLGFSTNNGRTLSMTSLRTKPSGQLPPVSLVNDDSPFDEFTEGVRPQFLPSVVVDPATGYLTVMWYDARIDASLSRAATYMATSMDGGATFGPQVSVSLPKVARDTITNKDVVLEPTPTNLAAAGDPGIGYHPASVLAFG